MRRALRGLLVIGALAIAAGAAVDSRVGAQGQAAPGGARPDLTGAWERIGPGALARGGGPAVRVPPPVPQPPLVAKYVAEWRAKQQAAREATAKGQPIGINWVNCLPDGMPGMMQGPFPLEILQTKNQVTIIQESFTQVRRILLDRPQKPIDEVDPSFYGYSIGRWEGDTLVAETVGIKERVQFQNVPHSDRMRIRERMRLVETTLLQNEITIEDPVTLEKPWTFAFLYRRMPEYTLLEYICEDNREYIDEKGLQRMRLAAPDAK